MNEQRIHQWATAYLHWLIPQVREGAGHQHKTYSDLLELMHAKEFVWLVPNDDNRIVDGLDLRAEFIDESDAPGDLSSEMLGACSVLEVLIGLAFAAGGEEESWAWQLLDNLELVKMHDPISTRKARKTDEILETLIWRRYEPDGQGGFFPLAFPEEDQTKLEIWYQMSAYISEIHPEYMT